MKWEFEDIVSRDTIKQIRYEQWKNGQRLQSPVEIVSLIVIETMHKKVMDEAIEFNLEELLAK